MARRVRTCARVGDGLAGGVVEVAELFAAEAGAAAAAAVGVDVAALEAFGCGGAWQVLGVGVDGVGHSVPGSPPPCLLPKYSKERA